MRRHDFPHCCGAQIITEFGFTNNYHTGDGPDQVMTEASKQSISTYLKDHILNSYTGMTVIMLNSAQVKAGVEKLVLDAGWERVTDDAYYPGHGRFLTLYVHYHHPTMRKSRGERTVPVKLVPAQAFSTDTIFTEKSKPGPIRKASLRLFSDTPSGSSIPKKKRFRRVTRKKKRPSSV